jgi:hypothetical protein
MQSKSFSYRGLSVKKIMPLPFVAIRLLWMQQKVLRGTKGQHSMKSSRNISPEPELSESRSSSVELSEMIMVLRVVADLYSGLEYHICSFNNTAVFRIKY